MFNVADFKKAVKILGRKVSTIDEFCKEVRLYMEATKKIAEQGIYVPKEFKKRLEYLRGEIEAERISYGEIVELQSLSEYIEPNDALLREWAGLPENMEASKKAVREKVENIYTFEELSPAMQSKVLDIYRDINVDHDWWDYTYDAAEQIGLKITSFDINSGGIKGHFVEHPSTVITTIMQNHGDMTETYKTAIKYKDAFTLEVDEDIERKFLEELLEDYLQILSKEYDYLTSDEAIKETILANDYEFTESGKIEASKKKADYQGYKNYETWLVDLWLDNNQFKVPEDITDLHELADYIKEMIEEGNPIADEASMYNDLLNSALSEVDYRQIAQFRLGVEE